MELNKIYNMDCLKGMRLLPNNYVDLTITSPPYDNLRKYKGYDFDFENIAKELYRVTKEGGTVVWIVSDATINGSETGTSFRQALYFKEIGFNLHDTMIWRKPNPIPQIKRGRYTNCFEYMFIFTKGRIKTCNYLTTPCLNGGKDMSKSSYKNYSQNEQKRKLKKLEVNKEKILTNVWDFNVGNGSGDDKFSKMHPATFPEKLIQNHILTWSNECEIVMDIFIGSGTTAKMALKNNRNFIGFEISDEYCEVAKQRIKDCS